MRIFAVAAAGVLVASCASVTRGTTNQVQVHSNPPEAQARTSMGHTCITPCTLQFSRKDEFTVLFTKQGFHSVEIPVKTQIAGSGAAGFAGNVILGGAVGMVVDASTGATLEHVPNPVSATLLPLKKGEQPRVIKVEPSPPPAPPADASAGEG
jgi:hypothetical protein